MPQQAQSPTMPHRVANFLRSSSGNLVQGKQGKQGKKSSSPRRSAPGSPSSPLASLFTPDHNNSNNNDDHAVGHPHHVMFNKMPESMGKRLSRPFGRSSRAGSADSGTGGPLQIESNIESPPIVFHGTPDESSGAMISGQMFLNVEQDNLEVESFVASLKLVVTNKKPYNPHCVDCAKTITNLEQWNFVSHPMKLSRGRHPFPFSHLLRGHLPASLNSNLLQVAYEFKAEATYSYANASSTSVGAVEKTPVKFHHTFPVSRALEEPESPHNSARVFPPTNIKVASSYNTVVRPSGGHTVALRLDGLKTFNPKLDIWDLWKVKKVSWKLEQTMKTNAVPCARHAPKDEEEARVGLVRTENRYLGEKILLGGWKSDFSGSDGTVEMEFDYSLNNFKRNKEHPQFHCDSRDRGNIQVSHRLLIELVVSKEYATREKPNNAAPTGTGRILRMYYNVSLTDHYGGVAWDTETPPIYGEVPPSPPSYPVTEEPPQYPVEDYGELEVTDAIGVSPESRRSSAT